MKRAFSLLFAIAVVGGVAAALLATNPHVDGGWTISAFRAARLEFNAMMLARSLTAVPCPASALVVGVLGQSNAGNHLGSRSAGDPNTETYAFFRGRCVRLVDPVPGATGADGSLWPNVARALAGSSKRPVVIITGAAGGSSVQDWRLNRYGISPGASVNLTGAARMGLAPRVIVWLQGETDATLGTTADDYGRDLDQVIAQFDAIITGASQSKGASDPKTNSPPLWLITQTSACGGNRDDGIRAAQAAAVGRGKNRRLGPDTDRLGDAFRRDGCHFNDLGRDRLAEEIALSIADAMTP